MGALEGEGVPARAGPGGGRDATGGDVTPAMGDVAPSEAVLAGGPGPLAGELRASDAERERTAAILSHEGAAGRLEPDECADRLAAAFAARTLPELYALTADLPYPDAVVPGEDPRPATAQGESLLGRLIHAWGRK